MWVIDFGGGRVSAATEWLARALWVITVGLVAVGLVLLVLTPTEFRTYIAGPNPVTFALIAVTTGSVGAVVAARRPANPIGWLLAVCGVALALGGSGQVYAIYGLFASPGSLPAPEFAAWCFAWASVGLFLQLGLVPLLFPTGRPPSRRWHPVLWLTGVLLTASTFAEAFAPRTITLGDERFTVGNPLQLAGAANGLLRQLHESVLALLISVAIIGASSLVARFVRASAQERQQIKWVAYATALGAAGFPLAFVLGLWTLGIAVFLGGLVGITVAVGIAILRYRLYDIDIIINRTVVYGALTAGLAGIYAGLTTMLQRLSIAMTGQTSDAVLIVSALAAGVAFTPMKNSLQATVDRHFKAPPSTLAAARASEPSPPDLAAEVAQLRADLASHLAAHEEHGSYSTPSSQGRRPASRSRRRPDTFS
jgi:hypothetical protein